MRTVEQYFEDYEEVFHVTANSPGPAEVVQAYALLSQAAAMALEARIQYAKDNKPSGPINLPAVDTEGPIV